MRIAPAFVVLAVMVMATAAVIVLSNRAAPGTVQPRASSTDSVGDVTRGADTPGTVPEVRVQIGPSYPGSLTRPPTADESQSKLWFNAGWWWGILADASTGALEIHRLDPGTAAWIDIGVRVDDRPEVTVDALWDGSNLYVAAAGTERATDTAARVTRYAFDPSSYTYVRDAGFPVTLSDRAVQHLNVTKDSDGVVWTTYVRDRQIWVAYSDDGGSRWQPAFPLPAEDEVTESDAIATVTYGSSVGVMWASRSDGAVYLTSHSAGEPAEQWTTELAASAESARADDHISARSIDGPSGPTLFAAVKTSFDLLPDSEPTDAQMLLLERRPDGEWRRHVVGRLQDRHTRPLVLIDEERRDLFVFAVSPFGGGAMFYKQTAVDAIEFSEGKGAPFLQLPEYPEITSPTSTKQNLTAATGLVVLASDEATNRYVHGALPLRPDP